MWQYSRCSRPSPGRILAQKLKSDIITLLVRGTRYGAGALLQPQRDQPSQQSGARTIYRKNRIYPPHTALTQRRRHPSAAIALWRHPRA